MFISMLPRFRWVWFFFCWFLSNCSLTFPAFGLSKNKYDKDGNLRPPRKSRSKLAPIKQELGGDSVFHKLIADKNKALEATPQQQDLLGQLLTKKGEERKRAIREKPAEEKPHPSKPWKHTDKHEDYYSKSYRITREIGLKKGLVLPTIKGMITASAYDMGGDIDMAYHPSQADPKSEWLKKGQKRLGTHREEEMTFDGRYRSDPSERLWEVSETPKWHGHNRPYWYGDMTAEEVRERGHTELEANPRHIKLGTITDEGYMGGFGGLYIPSMPYQNPVEDPDTDFSKNFFSVSCSS